MVAVNRHEVIETRDGPETRVPIRLVEPCDRVVGAKHLELGMGDPCRPDVIVQYLDVRQRRPLRDMVLLANQGTSRLGGLPFVGLRPGDQLFQRPEALGRYRVWPTPRDPR